jgi:hypothetical protein
VIEFLWFWEIVGRAVRSLRLKPLAAQLNTLAHNPSIGCSGRGAQCPQLREGHAIGPVRRSRRLPATILGGRGGADASPGLTLHVPGLLNPGADGRERHAFSNRTVEQAAARMGRRSPELGSLGKN